MDSSFALSILNVTLIGVILIAIYSMIKIINEIRSSKAHLTEDEIDDFVKIRIDTSSSAHTRFIAHLATCEACQEKLNNAQSDL